jgi:hypothetical protein
MHSNQKYRMNTTKLKPWTIKQLYSAMLTDLKEEGLTNLERQMTETICKKEIRDKAKEFSKTRKLTPCEIAILESI